MEKLKKLYKEKEQENEQIRKFFDSELTKSKQLFIRETIRSRKEENGLQEQFEKEVEERALQLIDEKSRSIYQENIVLKLKLEETEQQLLECSSEKEQFKQENKTLSRTIEMNKDLLKEYTKQCFSLSKELRTMNHKYDNEKVMVDIEKRFKEEKKILKEKYENQVKDLEKGKEELTKIVQLRNRELAHLRKIGKRLLEQRTELEMFFNEALGSVKEQIKSQSNVVTYAKEDSQVVLPPISKTPTIPNETPNNTSFTSLSWQEKEKVLRILFDKINGIPNKTSKTTAPTSEVTSPLRASREQPKLNNSLASMVSRFNTPSTARTND